VANTTLIYSFLIKSNACIYPSPPFIRSFHISSSANPLFSFFSSLSCRALHLYPLYYYRKCFFLGGSSCFQRIVFSMLEFCLGPRHLPSYSSSSSSSIDPPPPPGVASSNNKEPQSLRRNTRIPYFTPLPSRQICLLPSPSVPSSPSATSPPYLTPPTQPTFPLQKTTHRNLANAFSQGE